MTDADRARKLLDGIAEAYRKILGDKLTGIYEHGSLAFGCFRWAISDIDFLVVVREKPDLREKTALIRTLLDRRREAPDKGFEMSVVHEKDLKPFVYPTPFDLHFSDMWLAESIRDTEAYCRRMHGVDPDLAAHCTVMQAVGRTVSGRPVCEVFGETPREAYLDSIWKDVAGAAEEIHKNPVYVALNLCRVLAYLCEGRVLSKAEGGRWGAERLKGEYCALAADALEAYEKDGQFSCGEREAAAFAQYMLGLIARRMTGAE